MKLNYKKFFDKVKENNLTQKEIKESMGIGGTTLTNLTKTNLSQQRP